MTGWTRGPGGTGRAWTRGKRVGGEKLGPVTNVSSFAIRGREKYASNQRTGAERAMADGRCHRVGTHGALSQTHLV